MAKPKNDVVVVSGGNNAVTPVDVSKLKLVKRVVIPTISIADMKPGDQIIFKVEDAIRYTESVDQETGEIKIDGKTGENVMLPLLTVTNLHTGQFGQIVLPAIPHRALKDEGNLIGRMFAMQKGEPVGKGAKKTNLWDVVEVQEG